jgi:iron complex outermembrane recepter protein
VSSGYLVERGVPPETHVDDPRLWRYPHQSRVLLATSAGTGFHDTRFGRGDLEASVGLDVGRTEIDGYATEAYDEVVGSEDGNDRTLTLRVTGDLAPGARTDLRAAATFADVHHEEWLDDGPGLEYRQRLWSLGFEAERRVEPRSGLPSFGVLRLVAGVSVDGADTPVSGDKPPLERLRDWGARAGFSSLSESGQVLVHGSVSRRTRFPALRELYSGALGRFEPNPTLGPERLLGAELGLTLAAGRGEFQAVAFHQRLADGIVRTSVTTPYGPRFMRVNQDEVRSTGVELFGRGTWRALVVNGDLTLQRVRGLDRNGSEVRLEYEPALSGRAGVQGALPWALTGAGDVTFLSRQSCQNPEIGGLADFRSDPRVDLSLTRRFTLRGSGPLGRLEARLTLENVADTASFDQCGLPRPGRRLSLQARLW